MSLVMARVVEDVGAIRVTDRPLQESNRTVLSIHDFVFGYPMASLSHTVVDKQDINCWIGGRNKIEIGAIAKVLGSCQKVHFRG